MAEGATGTGEKPMRVGLAGLGFGVTEFLPALEKMPQLQIVAAADLRPQARQAFTTRYGGRAYERVEDLCADPDVEAIWIATPEQYHAQHALWAVERGKDVVVRKPLGLNPEECQRVVEAADRTGAKVLAGGQTQGTNALVQEIRRMAVRGDLGQVRAINMWASTGWMLRSRTAEEVDDAVGGGPIWRQTPHQLETIRWIGGGMVRSVRAITGNWRPERPRSAGYVTVLLEFEDGMPATFVYNGYGYYDSIDLVKWGEDKAVDSRAKRRKALLAGQIDELTEKESTRFGSLLPGDTEPQIPWEVGRASLAGGGGPWMPSNQGVFIVSFDRGDVKPSATGLSVYGDEGLREIPIPRKTGEGMAFMDEEAMELYDAVHHDRPMLHDARWGMATAEVQWAIFESARRREEVLLRHQVPVPAGY